MFKANRFLDLSIKFLTEKDAEILGCSGYPGAVNAYAEGFWVHVPVDDVKWRYEALTEYGMSAQFIELLKFGKKNKIWFLEFDVDGNDPDNFDFERYEW
jgi:hypothetical protein